MGERQARRSTATPPDGGWGWIVVFSSFMMHFFADGMIFSFGVYHHELVKHFQASEAATSLIASILVGLTLCVGPVASALVNKFGCRMVAAGGGFIGAMGIISSAFVNSITALQITIGVISGTGLGLIYLPATVAVTSYFNRKRALATGISVCGSGMGTFLMAPITQWLVQEYGWRGAMAISGALTFHCTVFGLLFRPLEQPRSNELYSLSVELVDAENKENFSCPEDEKDNCSRPCGMQPLVETKLLEEETKYEETKHQYGEEKYVSSEESRITEVKQLMPSCTEVPCIYSDGDPESLRPPNKRMFDFSLFKEPIFLVFGLSNFCTSLGFNVPFVYIVSQAEAKGVPQTEGSYLISLIGIANTSGRIILGFFFDNKNINRQYLYNLCLVIGGISTGLSTLCSNMTGFILFAVTFGFTVGAYAGLTSVIVVDLLGLDKLSDVFGLLLFFQGIANLLGPPITGWLYDSTKSYSPGFIVAGSVICTSGLMLFALPVIQRRHLTQNKGRN